MSTDTDTKPMSQMTDAELAKAGRMYDNVYNDGGDGYNPYKDEALRRDHARAVAEHEARLRTPEGRIEELQRRLRTECGSVARDCGNRDEIDALERDLYAQITLMTDHAVRRQTSPCRRFGGQGAGKGAVAQGFQWRFSNWFRIRMISVTLLETDARFVF